MANSNLTNAKKAKNDEFYTQFVDIQKEIHAYTGYDPAAFRGKTILLPCVIRSLWQSFTKIYFLIFYTMFKNLVFSVVAMILLSGCSNLGGSVEVSNKEQCAKLKIECSKSSTNLGIETCLDNAGKLDVCADIQPTELSNLTNSQEAKVDLENTEQYPKKEIEKCEKELGNGSKPWVNKYGFYFCGCDKGYVSKWSNGKEYCEKLYVSGEDYCVNEYGSRWTMNDLYGSCDCKPGYTQSDDGSFRCFTPSEYCIFLGQTGEECLKTIQQISDMLYQDGKLTPK